MEELYKKNEIENLSFEQILEREGTGYIYDSNFVGGTVRDADIKIGAGDSVLKADKNGIYLGNDTFASAPFRVTMAGALYATSADISGTITAVTGAIGGWTIGATTLSSTNIILDSANNRIQLSSTGEVESDNYTSGVFGTGFHLDANLLEVGNIACRGLIRTAVFQKDVVSVMGGNFAVLDGDVLDADMTVLD